MEEACKKCGVTWDQIRRNWSEWDGSLRHCMECGDYDAFRDDGYLIVGWEESCFA